MAHMVQPLTSKDKNATLSIEGFGAYDFISGTAMFHKVADMPDRDQLIPFMKHVHEEPFMRLGGGTSQCSSASASLSSMTSTSCVLQNLERHLR